MNRLRTARALFLLVLFASAYVGFSTRVAVGAQPLSAAAGPPAPTGEPGPELPPAAPVNVTGSFSKEPAPMGLVDYGVGPAGAYQYATNSSLGVADIRSLSTRNATGDPWLSIQLNVNLQFTWNGKQYVYWVQDVVQVDSSRNYVLFLDNVWNATARKASIIPGTISGGGIVSSSNGAGRTFYFRRATSSPGNGVALSYPATVRFQVDAATNSAGQPILRFSYDDGYGNQTYDTVTFNTNGKLALAGFVVNGYSYGPAGNFYDSELVLAGDSGGRSTTILSGDVRLQLEFWNGHNYQLITDGYKYGSDTAETITNAQVTGWYYPGSGLLAARLTAGPDSLGLLWSDSNTVTVDIKSPLTSGTLTVKNATDPNAVSTSYSFVDGEVRVVMYAGYYDLEIYQGNLLYSAGKFSTALGQTLQLRTPLSGIQVVFAYTIAGGGTGFSPPTVSYTYDGTPLNFTITGRQATLYLDSGSAWSLPSMLKGSGTTERWQTNQTTSGTATTTQTVSLAYYHQFLVSVSASPPTGGSVASVGGWYVAGATTKVSSSANDGWRLQDWNGVGSGAYSGTNASASITVNGPLSETAVFYARLSVRSSPGGSVTYSFGGPSGTVAQGSSEAIYVPAGTNVTLLAVPSSVLDVFTGWVGTASGPSKQVVVEVSSPADVRANYALNYGIIATALAVTVLALIAIVALTVRGRNSPMHAPPPGISPSPGPQEEFRPPGRLCSN